jgi:hypothetical protein
MPADAPSIEMQIDARVPGFIVVTKSSQRRAMARPTQDFATGFPGDKWNPLGSSNRSTPAFPDSSR